MLRISHSMMYPTLGDRRINDGDELIVRWPNGDMELVKVTVSDEYDHYNGSYSWAHTDGTYRGVKVSVRLDNIEAQFPVPKEVM